MPIYIKYPCLSTFAKIFFWLPFFVIVSCGGPTLKDKHVYPIIDSLVSVARDSMESNPNHSRVLLQQAIGLTSDSLDYYRIYSSLLQTYMLANNYDTGYAMAKKLIRFCETQPANQPLSSMLAEGCNYLGVCHGQMHRVDSAMHYYRLAIQHAWLSDRLSSVPDIYINLADMYLQQSDFVNSVFCYRRALSISDSLQIIDTHRFPAYFGLGQAYFGLGDYDLSDSYFRRAELELDERTLTEKFAFCNNRGNYYYYKGNYLAALSWFKRARALVLPGKYQFHINLCEGNLGDIYSKLDQLDSARYYLDRSYRFFKSINHYVFLYYIATVNAELALKQGDASLAGKWLLLYGSSDGVDPQIVSIRNKFLQEYYQTTGNYKLAYQYLLQNKQIDDSVRSERVKSRVAELDMRYKQDTILLRKNMLIHEQQNDLENLRLTKYFWVSIFVVFLLIGLLAFLYIRKKNEFIRLKHLDQISKLRLESVRNRISPHFIFNVLNHEIIAENNESERSELRGLVKLLRHSLEITEKLCVSLSKELDFVKTYIDIERKSLGDDFVLHWSIDENIDCNSVMLLSMIVQIPVENAIKHALRGKNGARQLGVRVTVQGSGVMILVEDNGNGNGFMQAPVEQKGTGTGLKVIYQTIELLNAKNEEKIAFTISTSERFMGGTQVSIYIPRNYLYEL